MIISLIQLTLCLSKCKGLRLGSNNSRCGSRFTGDCRLPLLHRLHSGLMSPQNAAPLKKNCKKIYWILLYGWKNINEQKKSE